MNKLFIIDAVNFLFRSYYGIGPMLNDKGQSTSALYGFIRSVQKIFKDFGADHAVCVFDGPDNKKSRQAVYAEYKMHRKGAPEDLFPQFELAYEYCELAGIPTLCVEGVEADDTMAAVAVWAAKKEAEVFLCSSDKDLMQLVSPHIFMVHAHKENLLIDSKKVEEIYGVRPDQILDLLAIMGDSSDNIPGLEGFGPKTAASLLKEFGTLDAILKHPEKVKGEKKQEVLRTQKDVALMSRELATLDLNVEVPKTEEFYRLKAPKREKLVEFFHSMKFSSLIREIGEVKKKHVEKREYKTVDVLPEPIPKELGIYLAQDGIAFAYEPGVAYFVKGFSLPHASFYGHDVKKDYHRVPIKHITFDTLIASYLLNPQSRRHGLEDLVLEHFKKIKTDDPCETVDYICQLKEIFVPALKEKHLERLFHDIELPLIPILAEMEKTGIYLDVGELKTLATALNAELTLIKQIIFNEVGEEFNLNSPKQLGHILYDKLGIPGKSSTAADVLEELAPDYPIIQQILNYRVLEKLRSTYAEALPHSVNPMTGRIHCTFMQSVTATGRLSCQDPNLQNIPIRSTQGLAIRSCFKPQKPGWLFLGADYSQIELRLLAHFSEDPELQKAFKNGEDIHAHTASLVFGVPVEMVEPEMRAQAKTVNFGIIYGQGPFGLSKQLGISMRDASSFIKTYFERYPNVNEYFERCKEEARKTGVAKTLTGRQRPIPEIHNQNPSIRAAAERLAINTPLQGTAADLIKMAMIEIDREIHHLKGKMILQIHDELIFEMPEDEVHLFEKIVKDKMEHVLKLKVPIEVHIAIGKNWAEC